MAAAAHNESAHIEPFADGKLNRRTFVTTGLLAFGTGLVSMRTNASSLTAQTMTVQNVIDIVIKAVPGAPFAQTVDTLKAGKGDQMVTGIIITMFATIEVIKKAIALNANFIIAHEPTFYNHLDDVTDVQNDAVYKYKKDLLDRNGIAVWRCHDYVHSLKPDGILTGVLKALGWEKLYDPQNPNIVTIESQSLETLVAHVRQRIGAPHLRFCGAAGQSCSRIAVMPGAAGGKRQIKIIMDQHPDVLICGEVAEWETAEYIRDAIASGEKKSLIVMGHAVSEEPGMQWMAGWLAPQVHHLPVTHIASKDPFADR